MNAKLLGGVQLVGALIAGWFAWQGARWDSLVLALVFLIMSIHHFQE